MYSFNCNVDSNEFKAKYNAAIDDGALQDFIADFPNQKKINSSNFVIF